MGHAGESGDYQAGIARNFLKFALRPWSMRGILSRLHVRSRRLLAGAKILVVGCARGKDCTYFVEFGSGDVHGVDIVGDIGADFQHPCVRYHRCSAEQVDFPSDTFDFVYSAATMEHVPRIERAFQEMVRVTRPGGMVYTYAAPLWNSQEGHHKFGLFPGQPWIHLRMSKDELVDWCRRNGIRSSLDYDVAADVEFIFSDYFNREPSTRYVDVCSRLPVSRIVMNEIGRDPPSTLSNETFKELQARGHTREELLARRHKFVAIK
jgi:SAM-dependent methyltransferase